MQIILLDKITNLGDKGKIVCVKSGYARNFLIPKGKAILANKNNIEHVKIQQIEFERKQSNIKAIAKSRIEKLHMLGSVNIFSKAGSNGKLFGSIGARDIAHAITSAGIKVLKKEIRLTKGILKTVGSYNINIEVYKKMLANFKINIIPKN